MHTDSVVNAAIYPPNWATLKTCCLGSLKLGYFLSVCPGQPFFFFFWICQFSVNSESFWEFSTLKHMVEHSFHQSLSRFLSISCRGQQSDCLFVCGVFFLSFFLSFFPLLGDFCHFTAQKHLNFKIGRLGCFRKKCYLEVASKKPICRSLALLHFGNTAYQYNKIC